MYFLKRLKRVSAVNVRLLVYEAFIKSHICYGIEAWYSGLTKEQKDIIYKIQKRAIRIIRGKLEHTNVSFRALNILKVEDMYETSVVNRALKVQCHNTHPLNKYYTIIERNCRSQGQLRPKVRGKSIATQCKIINKNSVIMKAETSAKTKIKHLTEEKIQGYSTDCVTTNCHICA